MNGAVRLKREAEVHLFPRDALQFGKQPRHGMGVLPDMPAGARATTDPLPGIEPSVAETMAGGGG